MTGAGATADGRDGGRPWLIAGAACALVATAALMLTDDPRWLRLGIVAALWAALLGAFLATKYRREAESAWDSLADAQHIYELELEREITARREYELELEAASRRRVEHDTQWEIQQLRAEVMELRDTLQQLMSGEVMYERAVLTEQSTRRRSAQVEGGPPTQIGGAPQFEEVAAERTQVISRVIASSRQAPLREQPSYVDEPRREPEPPPRQLEPPRPEPVSEQPQYSDDFSFGDHVAGNGNGHAGANGAGSRYVLPTYSLYEPEPPSAVNGNGANGNGTNGRHGSDNGDLSSLLGAPDWGNGHRTQQPQDDHSWFTPSSPAMPEPDEQAGGSHRKPDPEANQSLPPGAREIQQQRPGGRRRKPDDEDDLSPPPQPPPPPPAPPQPEEDGSHASGRSVHDLLAAHGRDTAGRRHRYRD